MSRALDLLGVVSPSAATVAAGAAADVPLTKTLIPGVAAGIAGVALCPRHPLLGFLGGDAIGLNAYRLYRGQGDDRVMAACNIAIVAAGIAGSLLWKKHPGVGFALGFAAGVVATAAVPGSNAHRFAQKVFSR